jgi:glycosyltransferase involved in cell wall biosynthesis
VADRDWAKHLSVVIPAFNEAEGIAPTLAGLRQAIPECEIIVVDDGSTDATCAEVSAFGGVRLIRHGYNRGYGGALKTGIRAATRRFVAWFDADNEHRPEDLERMTRRMMTEPVVAVIGRRDAPGASVVRSSGKLAIRWVARLLGVSIGKDLNCGLRVFRRSVILRYLPLLPDAFSASMTSTMILVERGYSFAFEPIVTNARIGTSKVRLGDGFFTIALVLRMVMLFAPMRIFLGGGGIMILTGSAYGLFRAYSTGRGLPVAGLLVIMTGILLIMFGLVADQLSALRLGQLTAPSDEADIEEAE